MPKLYGPQLGTITWTNHGSSGEFTITDDRTGQEVVFVSKVWLDGVLAGAGGDKVAELAEALELNESLRKVRVDALKTIEELEHKLGREIAVSRELAIKLDDTEAVVRQMAKNFMDLHDAAKKYAGPKIRPQRPPLIAPTFKGRSVSTIQLNEVDPELIELMTGEPAPPKITRLDAVKAMEADSATMTWDEL